MRAAQAEEEAVWESWGGAPTTLRRMRYFSRPDDRTFHAGACPAAAAHVARQMGLCTCQASVPCVSQQYQADLQALQNGYCLTDASSLSHDGSPHLLSPNSATSARRHADAFLRRMRTSDETSWRLRWCRIATVAEDVHFACSDAQNGQSRCARKRLHSREARRISSPSVTVPSEADAGSMQ